MIIVHRLPSMERTHGYFPAYCSLTQLLNGGIGNKETEPNSEAQLGALILW